MAQQRDVGILVVDDEEHIRVALERILKRVTDHILCAETGEKALEMMREHPIDLVLLDLKMPGMDGMEVLRVMKEVNRELLIIVITGFATLETAVEAMKLGAYDFIPKPFDKEHILLVVERAVENILLKREKHRLEKEKRETLFDLITEKSRLRTIMDVLPNGVIVTNRRCEVVLMNQRAREHLDIPPRFSPGDKLEDYINDPHMLQFILTPEEGTGEGVLSCEFQMGTDRYLLLKKSPIITDTHKFVGHVVITVDITPLKKLDQLKSEFVARVSHELKGSLSTIHEQIAMVLQDIFEDPEFKRDKGILERAKQRTKGLTQLIEKLLDLSRIESGQVYVDVKDICVKEFLNTSFVHWQDEALLKSQEITLTAPLEEDVVVKADIRAFKMMLDNLVGNAIKYTPQGGRIEIRAYTEGNLLKIEVEDTGIGIAPAEKERIFDRFYRATSSRDIRGTGLGLAIVKGIISELKGKIEVESEPGEGSTFTVTLPLSSSKKDG